SHAGPLADFGPSRLTDADWQAIEAADAVAVVNWAQNRQGTRLLSTVARRLGGDRFLYFDAGDPRHRGADAQALAKSAPWWPQVGAFGVNDNELSAFLGREIAQAEYAEAAQELAARLGTRVDFHCRKWAASATADGIVRVPALAEPGLRSTGAGDAWNAGNLAGELLGLPDRERLRLAHTVATAYVTSPDGLPPTAASLLPRKNRPPRLVAA
ncbi:MAG: PfkB family carbohydrate kinase, partial [Halobacteriales archaeon]|nr:PfkB family carbohydrate kinase [Halobacteriales archaeon]